MKKKNKKVSNRLLSAAKKTAFSTLRSLGKPVLIHLNNWELAKRLSKEGILPPGEYGKKSAPIALVAWYKSMEAKKENKTDDFLKSWEWTELRYRAIKLHGRKCQCCGAKPPEIVIHVDHIKPRSKYPELALDINNLQVLCELCNRGKSNIYEDDFRP